jgi:hypothetical protein
MMSSWCSDCFCIYYYLDCIANAMVLKLLVVPAVTLKDDAEYWACVALALAMKLRNVYSVYRHEKIGGREFMDFCCCSNDDACIVHMGNFYSLIVLHKW